MRHLLIVCALLGRMFAANQCAEHNIFLSEDPIKVSMTGSARCTPGEKGGIHYNCPQGSAGMSAWGFDIQSSCYTNWVSYAVQAPDSSSANHYDLGLYYIGGPSAASLAGHLMVHIGIQTGTTFAPHAGLTTVSWVGTENCQIPCTLPAGQYALTQATDCTANCAALWGDGNHGYMYLFNVWLGGAAGTGANASLLPTLCPSGQPPSCTYYIDSGLPVFVTPPATDPALSSAKFPEAPMLLIF